MNEYITLAQLQRDFEPIAYMIIFSTFVSMFVVIHWAYLALVEFIDFIYDVTDKRKAKNIASNDVAKNI